ncbi:MAG: hypothetical protein Q8P29_02340 [Candidatus Levybacteria bacterium]|nr:hypothetical protein [Candidatus Levybacteria bacterium]MDZ4228533.1 hypothetical protein [Candidatus Levybacteria bacterium]
MIQKIIQIGNSMGTIIPQLLTQDLGLKLGDTLKVEKKGNKLILFPIKKTRKNLASGVNAKFAKIVDEFVEKHEDVLAELARK